MSFWSDIVILVILGRIVCHFRLNFDSELILSSWAGFFAELIPTFLPRLPRFLASGARVLQKRERAFDPGNFRQIYAPRDFRPGFSPNLRAVHPPALLILQKFSHSGGVWTSKQILSFGFIKTIWPEFVFLVILGRIYILGKLVFVSKI